MEEGRSITVEPCGEGWTVRCDEVCEPVIFLSAARAEQHAKVLAVAIARSGSDVRLRVTDRDYSVVGAGRYFAIGPRGVWLSLA